MVNDRRSTMESAEEPPAFRMEVAVPSSPPTSPRNAAAPDSVSDWDQSQYTPYAGDFYRPSIAPAAAPRAMPDWLNVPALSSPGFNAHDFVQRAVAERFDQPLLRGSPLPPLEDSFNADAALSALHYVESAMRRRRDVARKDEDAARETLRHALHASSKKRDDLVRSADSVSAAVSVAAQSGREAAKMLTTATAPLVADSQETQRLHDARDLVRLLTEDDGDLSIVRASTLLGKVRGRVDAGLLPLILSKSEAVVAAKELDRCEQELSTCLMDWMEEGMDNGDTQAVRECAQAAEMLNLSSSFLQVYVSRLQVFSEGPAPPPSPMRTASDDVQATAALEPLRIARWEAVKAVREFIPRASASFPCPGLPLATLVKMVTTDRLLATANTILRSLHEHTPSEADEKHLRELVHIDPTASARETLAKSVASQRRYLVASSSAFHILSRTIKELIVLCATPGVMESAESRTVFETTASEFSAFVDEHKVPYLKLEKRWLEEQIGDAFSEVSRLESQAPDLAPSSSSGADVYHRYHSFYGRISSHHEQMTRRAVESTLESLHRCASVQTHSVPLRSSEPTEQKEAESEDFVGDLDEADVYSSSSASRSAAHAKQGGECVVGDGTENGGNDTQFDIDSALTDLCNRLIFNYLANAETVLQAATHLLPVNECAAKMPELWTVGASPLAAYAQALEMLADSDELVDDFLRSLKITDHISELASDRNSLVSGTDEDVLEQILARDVRSALRMELSSGLTLMAAEAQIGIETAVASVKVQLIAILDTPSATEVYAVVSGKDSGTVTRDAGAAIGAGLEDEPSMAFVTAASFVEQQLTASRASLSGGNRDFVITAMAHAVRDAILRHWGCCRGPFSITGALLLVADARAILRVFQGLAGPLEILGCLSAVGQLFLESADELWSTVESRPLASIGAKTLVALLGKRGDYKTARIDKIRQSLTSGMEAASAAADSPEPCSAISLGSDDGGFGDGGAEGERARQGWFKRRRRPSAFD